MDDSRKRLADLSDLHVRFGRMAKDIPESLAHDRDARERWSSAALDAQDRIAQMVGELTLVQWRATS